MKFILGTKQNMTQLFDQKGNVVPVTKVIAGPCLVTQVKTQEKDGYGAVQVGFGYKKNLSKPLKNHLKDLPSFKHIREFDLTEGQELKRGDSIVVSTFEPGDKVKVVGTSKGKGFQGVVRRHGFKGQHATHGTKDQIRMGGSIGPTGPARVFKGLRMPGHMGTDRVTVKNLEVFSIDLQENVIYIKGAIPGARQSLVMITADGDLKVNEKPEAKETKEEKTNKTEEKKEEVKKEETEKEEPKEEKTKKVKEETK